MSFTAAVVIAYGSFSLAGGIIGYVKANSKASLIAGTLSGTILLISGYGITHGSFVACIASLIIAVLLGARFLKTWRKTHRVMPDLLMIVLSLTTFVSVGIYIFQR